MPKVTKKKSKTLTTETKKTEPVKKAPEIEPGLVSLAFTPEDLRTFANLMSITAKTFEKLAMDAAQGNDEAAFTVLQARYRLSSVFADRLVDACKMPEPVSRDIH